MGCNLAELFTQLSRLPDEDVAALHPAHTAKSIQALLPRLHYYTSGTCIVHHIFGGETCEVVQQVRHKRGSCCHLGRLLVGAACSTS